MAAVLMREPDLETLPKEVHPRLADLVRRCLDKNPRRRWQAIGDVRFELDAIAADPGGLANRSGTTATPARRDRGCRSRDDDRVGRGRRRGRDRGDAMDDQSRWIARRRPLFDRAARGSVAAAPAGADARAFARRHEAGLRGESTAVRAVDVRHDRAPISGTALDVTSPFFSPDGQWIGFFAFQD